MGQTPHAGVIHMIRLIQVIRVISWIHPPPGK